MNIQRKKGQHEKMEKSFRFDWLIQVTLGVMVILSLVNLSSLQNRMEKVEQAKEIAQELMRPALLEIVAVEHVPCDDCSKIQDAIASLEKLNVNITSTRIVRDDSEEGLQLIREFHPMKLPIFVAKGEVNKSDSLALFFNSNGKIIDSHTAFYAEIPPPYYDLRSNDVKGRVSFIYLNDEQCKACKPLTQIEGLFSNAGVSIVSIESYDYASADGKNLVKEHGVTRVPALLISEDIEIYDAVLEDLQNIATKTPNGFYAIHAVMPPYRELSNDALVGVADLFLLTDESCKECYDVALNVQIINRFGVALDEVTTYDVSSPEGGALVDKYAITKVPMILLSPDAKVYTSFAQIWKQVGSEEEDGWFVMRKPEVLGTYKDLSKNEIVQQKKQ